MTVAHGNGHGKHTLQYLVGCKCSVNAVPFISSPGQHLTPFQIHVAMKAPWLTAKISSKVPHHPFLNCHITQWLHFCLGARDNQAGEMLSQYCEMWFSQDDIAWGGHLS